MRFAWRPTAKVRQCCQKNTYAGLACWIRGHSSYAGPRLSPQLDFLESVRGLHQGLHSFRNMRRMEASLRKARALRLRFSQSLASRRQRFSQAIVRSTIQRLGNGSNPLARSERLTISVLRLGRTLPSAVWKIDPA